MTYFFWPDSESGTNEYSEDPNDPINKPWTVPPTSASPTISKVAYIITFVFCSPISLIINFSGVSLSLRT